MIGNSERQRLERHYLSGAMPSPTLAARCAAGIAILFGIALFGIQSPSAPEMQEPRGALVASAPGPDGHDCGEAAPGRDAETLRGPGCGTPRQSESGVMAAR